MIRQSVLMLLAGLATMPAQAADCLQSQAVYGQEGSTVKLQFHNKNESFVVTNGFDVLLKDGPTLQGMVIWNNGVSRPNGMVQNNCPEGDVTGDELAKCTLWEGVMYTIAEDGSVDLLPAADEPAVTNLLLPDISRALYYSALNDGKADLNMFDSFKLESCNKS